MPFVDAGGHRLEYEWLGPGPDEAPTIVMLHEGLGSVSMWRDFPARVQEASGLGVLVYSRWGYGKSEPFRDFPRAVHYLNPEGQEALPDLLRALGVDRPILLGHSDGASIAIVYAGSGIDPAPLGVILMAPHVFVEHVTTVSIAKARVAYEAEGLRDRLARHHNDVDSAFYGWNTIWMRPQFIWHWNIEHFVDRIACPITVIQGAEDEYGTEAQYASIREHSGGRAEIVILPQCGHSPQRDQPEMTMDAILAHLRACKAAA